MEPAAARALVRELVAELHGHAADEEPLALESLTVVLLVEALEDRHGLAVPIAEVTPGNFATIASLAGLVARLAP